MSGSSSATDCVYRGFLSYSHRDKSWAAWLHHALETYRVPRRLVGRRTAHGTVPRRLHPIFRDREELASATELGRKVNEALAQSETLIVICSPASAASPWVNEEVLAYKRLGRGERIFCLVVDGEPGASDELGHEAEECFCPALRFRLDANGQPTRERTEPIAADARPDQDGKANAKLKLIAGMLDVGFDQLKQREQQRRFRRMAAVTALALVVMAVTSLLAVYALFSRQDAIAAEHQAVLARQAAERRQQQAEELVGFMLGDLHDKLKSVGRLDLMASVTDKALALFAASAPGSLTDLELTQQSRALVQIGENRMDEGRYGPAMDAFRRAYQRSVELTTRHPGNGHYLYDRAQAEYWIGDVYRQQRNLAKANEWLTRYRDSTLALLEIDPDNKKWELETTYGENNLAVLALDRNDLDAAQKGFEAELATQQRLLRQQPDDPELASDIADTISWLGNVAERRGDLAEAQRLFADQARRSATLHSGHPQDFLLLSRWATSRYLLAKSLSTTGRVEESLREIAGAVKAEQALTHHDPENVQWRIDLAGSQILYGSYALAARDFGKAEGLVSAAMHMLKDLGRSPASGNTLALRRHLCRAWLLRAQLAMQRGDFRTATSAAEQSLRIARSGNPSGAADAEGSVADRADALLLLGSLQKRRSPDAPSAAWAEVRELLAGRAEKSHYWRLLDPWLRLCRLTGEAACAQTALDRLNASGYVPLQPWPPLSGQSTTVATFGDPP